MNINYLVNVCFFRYIFVHSHIVFTDALPIFLLRLATQVDWTREKHCFHEISKELGNFYAMLPCKSENLNSYVQHNLFPALSYLLLPSKNQARNGYYSNMTKLSTLYKVFERCWRPYCHCQIGLSCFLLCNNLNASKKL